MAPFVFKFLVVMYLMYFAKKKTVFFGIFLEVIFKSGKINQMLSAGVYCHNDG